MSEEYTAPCVGGPMNGKVLPYDYKNRQAFPSEYIVKDIVTPYADLGKYIFQLTRHQRKDGGPHGDTWVWHPFLAGM